MRLRADTPFDTVAELDTAKLLVTTADRGSACFLPHHADIVATLEAGIAIATDPAGIELYIAHGPATLVKCGDEIRIAADTALAGTDLSALRGGIEAMLEAEREEEARSGSAIARLELGLVRRLVELERRHGTR